MRADRRELVGIFLLIVLARLPSLLGTYFDGDEGTFAAIAMRLRDGALYEAGGVDNKFPGIYWIYGLAFRLGGGWSMRTVHALALLFVLATAALLHRAAGGGRAGRLAALFYGVFTVVGPPKLQAAITEIFMMLPLAAAFCLGVRARPSSAGARQGLLDGAMVALGCAFKQVAAAQLAVSVVAAVHHGRGRSALWPLAGFALGLGALFGAVAATATLDGLGHWAIASLFAKYGPSGWSAARMAPLLVARVLPFLGGTALLWWLACSRRPHDATDRLAIAWTAASVLAVLAGGRFFPHYFVQLVAPLSVLAARALDAHLAGARARLCRRLAIAGVAIPLAGALALTIPFDPWSGGVGASRPDLEAVAREIRARTPPEGRILVWGSSGLLYLASERRPATRFVGFLRGLDRGNLEPAARAWDVAEAVWPALDEDLARTPPDLVVDLASSPDTDMHAYPMSSFPALSRLRASCMRVAEIDGVTLCAPRRPKSRRPRRFRGLARTRS